MQVLSASLLSKANEVTFNFIIFYSSLFLLLFSGLLNSTTYAILHTFVKIRCLEKAFPASFINKAKHPFTKRNQCWQNVKQVSNVDLQINIIWLLWVSVDAAE